MFCGKCDYKGEFPISSESPESQWPCYISNKESNERAKNHIIYLLISGRGPVNRKAIFNSMLWRQEWECDLNSSFKKKKIGCWAQERT